MAVESLASMANIAASAVFILGKFNIDYAPYRLEFVDREVSTWL